MCFPFMVGFLLFCLSAKFRLICNCGTRFSETRTIQSPHWLLCSVRSFVKIASFMKSTFSVYSFQFIYLVYVHLLFGALMGFKAKCVCSKHSTWHHGDISAASLQIASPEELEVCGVDTSKNKTRKRKICLPCRERIALELKCQRYEVSLCLQASNLQTDSQCVIFLLHYCASHSFLLLWYDSHQIYLRIIFISFFSPWGKFQPASAIFGANAWRNAQVSQRKCLKFSGISGISWSSWHWKHGELPVVVKSHRDFIEKCSSAGNSAPAIQRSWVKNPTDYEKQDHR